MGFECGFKLTPKITNVSAKQSLAAADYLEFINWLNSDWCQKQLQNGYYFKFEEHSNFTTDDLPNGIELEKLAKHENIYKADSIFYLCSAGKLLDRIIRYEIKNSSEALDRIQDYFNITADDLKHIVKYCYEELTSMISIPVHIVCGYKNNGNDLEELEIDGIIAEVDGNGQDIKIPVGSLIEWAAEELDIEERDIYKKIKEAAEKMLSEVDFENNYLIYYRSE